jgi:hypothetical protein
LWAAEFWFFLHRLHLQSFLIFVQIFSSSAQTLLLWALRSCSSTDKLYIFSTKFAIISIYMFFAFKYGNLMKVCDPKTVFVPWLFSKKLSVFYKWMICNPKHKLILCNVYR